MLKDQCILVDKDDRIVGSANKYQSHRFTPDQPKGLLHRAFSVFLFNQDGKLLLQQRAPSKITFPGVWTNTCCSHPLHGYSPSEVDQAADLEDGSVMGVKVGLLGLAEYVTQVACMQEACNALTMKEHDYCCMLMQHAAVRKLKHELGIPPQQLPLDSFKFLTRLHYCAPDTDTYGEDAEWGEHEVTSLCYLWFFYASPVESASSQIHISILLRGSKNALAIRMCNKGDGNHWHLAWMETFMCLSCKVSCYCDGIDATRSGATCMGHV
jgi:isopentenyl-diphosphate delta-isomerase